MGQSKASNETDYVDLQIRVSASEGDGDTFKVQGSGSPSNRSYGVSDMVTVSPSFGIGGWVKGLDATASSLTGSGTDKYVPVQAAIRQNSIHFQINGPIFSEGNINELSRDYGAIFNIPVGNAPALADFVHSNATGEKFNETIGTDDGDTDDDSWSGSSTYAPDDDTGKCSCSSCNSSTNSDGTLKTVVIDGVTYNITPIE